MRFCRGFWSFNHGFTQMNTDYKHKELTKIIINRFYEVYNEFGPTGK